jgi:hypothetical protein
MYDDPVKDTDLAWLAGLLEGEGSFFMKSRAHASQPNARRTPCISVKMTDLDVVTRAATLMGTAVTSSAPQGRKPIHATILRGSRARMLMSELAPLMGERRQSKIAEILA